MNYLHYLKLARAELSLKLHAIANLDVSALHHASCHVACATCGQPSVGVEQNFVEGPALQHIDPQEAPFVMLASCPDTAVNSMDSAKFRV